MKVVALMLLTTGCDAVFGTGPPPPVGRSICSTMSMLSDDFDDGVLVPW